MKSQSPTWQKTGKVLLNVAFSIAILPLITSVSAKEQRNLSVRGIPSTGINEVCGSPQFILPLPVGLPPKLNATSLGQYNPGAALPIPLSASNCSNDIILATTTDTDFLAATGSPDANIAMKNLPLRQNYVVSDQDGSRSELQTLNSTVGNALPPTKSEPNYPITLGKWLSARGNLQISCKTNGSATVEGRFSNLIPNGVYTMWGVWTTNPPGPPVVPVPFGGIPNAVIPDQQGKATFYRKLASCPMRHQQDGSLLMLVNLAYHSDSAINGVLPELGAQATTIHPASGNAFSTIFAPGIVTHETLAFPINVQVLKQH